jgi:hypothetical protein
MTEPTTTISSIVAALSMLTTALFGIDYYSILWGMLGALLAASQAPPSERWRAMVSVVLSTLVGAVFGEAAIAALVLMFPGGNVRPILFFACTLGGYGGAVLVTGCVDAVLSRIKNMGAKP